MAITKSAKKALRVAKRRRVFNARRKSALHDAEVSVRKALAGGEGAAALLPSAYAAVDKAAKRGVISKNAAARKKARLAKALVAPAK